MIQDHNDFLRMYEVVEAALFPLPVPEGDGAQLRILTSVLMSMKNTGGFTGDPLKEARRMIRRA